MLKFTLFQLSLLPLLLSSCTPAHEESEVISETDTTEQVVKTYMRSDTLVLHRADSNYTFSEYKNGEALYGFKNREGKVIIPPRFYLAGDFYGNVAPVIYKGQHGFCDTSGNLIYSLKKCEFYVDYNELSGEKFLRGYEEGLFKVNNPQGKTGFVNDSGKLVIPCQFEWADYFSEGLAAFMEYNQQGYLDTSGTIVIKPQFDRALSFSEGLAAVYKNAFVGFIDHQGNYVIDPVYRQAYYFKEGLTWVTKSPDYTNYYYIDQTGKTVIPGPFDNASNFENGEAIIEKRGVCRVIDRTGKELRKLNYDYFAGC